MAVIVNASMDCDGNVVVHVTNDTASTFHGQSATAGSWIVPINLRPGESTDAAALFKYQASVSGYVQGHLDGDPTYISVPWTAARACTVVTTVPPPVDTTPHPLPTTPEDPTIYCAVPGANPPMKVPCDDPRATTPYEPVTPPTTAPAAPVDTTVVPVAAEPAAVHTGPPRTHAVTTQPKTLPATGSNETAGVLGGGLLAVGVVLVCLTRRRARPA